MTLSSRVRGKGVVAAAGSRDPTRGSSRRAGTRRTATTSRQAPAPDPLPTPSRTPWPNKEPRSDDIVPAGTDMNRAGCSQTRPAAFHRQNRKSAWETTGPIASVSLRLGLRERPPLKSDAPDGVPDSRGESCQGSIPAAAVPAPAGEAVQQLHTCSSLSQYRWGIHRFSHDHSER